MLQILSLHFALHYCFARDKKKKRTYFRETADGSPRSSIVSRMNFPWGLQRQKKHFNVTFSSCSLIDLISGQIPFLGFCFLRFCSFDDF